MRTSRRHLHKTPLTDHVLFLAGYPPNPEHRCAILAELLGRFGALSSSVRRSPLRNHAEVARQLALILREDDDNGIG